jgi:uncharacterized protein
LGGKVNKKKSKIADPFGEQEVDVLVPDSGMVIGPLNLPLVHQGYAVFHITCFKNPWPVKFVGVNFHSEIKQELQ